MVSRCLYCCYLSGVEFDSKTTRVSESFRAAPFMNDSGKPEDDRSLNARSTEEISTGKVSYVMSDFKKAFGTSSPGMNNTFRNAFPVEIRKFLHQMVIFQQYRTCPFKISSLIKHNR